MIWEGIMFNGEVDVLRMHLGTLDPVVDKFVIVEGRYTFSGKKKKGLSFADNQDMFKEWLPKIEYLIFDWKPETNRWVNETRQRNYLGVSLDKADTHDIIIISDADEIADPAEVKRFSEQNMDGAIVFDTWAYYYYLDYMMEPQEPTSTRAIVMGRKRIMSTPQTFREMRLGLLPIKAGWHFSYLGGVDAIAKKISEFSHSEYDDPYYKDPQHLLMAMNSKRDLFDRPGINFRVVPISYPTHPHWLINNLQDYLKYISNVPDVAK